MTETSTAEKRLKGTYQPCRDKTKGISVRGEVVSNIKPPRGLSAPVLKSWREVIPYLCGLGIIYKQDIPSLQQAWTTLQDIFEMDRFMRETKLETDEYVLISNTKIKYIRTYNDIMARFLVSPKERLKAVALFAETQPPGPPNPADKLLERE